MSNLIETLRDIFVLSGARHVATGETDTKVLITPIGYQSKPLTGPDYQLNPCVVRSTVRVGDLESFLAYYNQYCDADSVVFCDGVPIEKSVITGIIDYHTENVPGWGLHRVLYDFPMTEEWKVWMHNSKRVMSQVEFARFIEDGIDEVIEPAGAQMLEISRTLEAKTGVDFRSAIRLDNGERQFTYQENIAGKAGLTGTLKIPEEFKLGLRVFKGGPAYAMRARFRYRLKEGSLAMWYELVHADRVYDDAVADVITKVGDGVKAGTVFNGAAPPAQD